VRRWPVLIILSGLPASGKTTVGRGFARATGAVHVRVDTIEQAIVSCGAGSHPLGPVGYVLAHAVAADHLRQGLTVVAESVNPLEITRAGWRGVASAAGAPYLEVEVVCSDPDEHRRRAEGRVTDIPGLPQPTWQDITTREYDPWHGERLVLDTAHAPVDDCVSALRRAVEGAR
jgi:predicted kinase